MRGSAIFSRNLVGVMLAYCIGFVS
jgi:hypothetical protein